MVSSVSSIKPFYLKLWNSFLVLIQVSSQHTDEKWHLCETGILPRGMMCLLFPRRKARQRKKKSCLIRPEITQNNLKYFTEVNKSVLYML